MSSSVMIGIGNARLLATFRNRTVGENPKNNARVFAEDSVVPLWMSRFHSEKNVGLTIRNCNFD